MQPGDGAHNIVADFFAENVAGLAGSDIMPNDGVVQGLTCVFVPHNNGFPLVGNADGFDLGRRDIVLLPSLADTFVDACYALLENLCEIAVSLVYYGTE